MSAVRDVGDRHAKRIFHPLCQRVRNIGIVVARKEMNVASVFLDLIPIEIMLDKGRDQRIKFRQTDFVNKWRNSINGFVGKALIEAGCSKDQAKAITGHTTDEMLDYYAEEAEQKVLAKAAIRKLERRKQ